MQWNTETDPRLHLKFVLCLIFSTSAAGVIKTEQQVNQPNLNTAPTANRRKARPSIRWVTAYLSSLISSKSLVSTQQSLRLSSVGIETSADDKRQISDNWRIHCQSSIWATFQFSMKVKERSLPCFFTYQQNNSSHLVKSKPGVKAFDSTLMSTCISGLAFRAALIKLTQV